jgi:hypothetical protein
VYRRLSRGQAEDIPDIYWEQAARELDFCTCRKCQVEALQESVSFQAETIKE